MSRRAVGRVLAALVGVEWFVLLIFGGLGLLFGPMAWLAAALGGRAPRAALVLLGLPVMLLVASWIPVVFDRSGALGLADALAILGFLTLPAVLAAGLIAASPGPARPGKAAP